MKGCLVVEQLCLGGQKEEEEELDRKMYIYTINRMPVDRVEAEWVRTHQKAEGERHAEGKSQMRGRRALNQYLRRWEQCRENGR